MVSHRPRQLQHWFLQTEVIECNFYASCCVQEVQNITNLAVYFIRSLFTEILFYSVLTSYIGWYKQQGFLYKSSHSSSHKGKFIASAQIHLWLYNKYMLSQFWETNISYLLSVPFKQSIPESLMLYWMVELLSIAEKLQECRIIHGDIKPDNFILRTLWVQNFIHHVLL
jgi:serine/threonine protein kinase